MDSQFPATRDDLYNIQMDLKHVQAVQTNHADRLLRLEKRQADDAALKSVWGNGSPFPSVLSGTPNMVSRHFQLSNHLRQLISRFYPGPVQNPPPVFDDFDDEQGHNLLGSLQLEADEEPVGEAHHEPTVFGLMSALFRVRAGPKDPEILASLVQFDLTAGLEAIL